jgi:hypothetical protein
MMPSLALPDPDKYNYLLDERDKGIVDALVHMPEAKVRITHDYHGPAAIHYREILPPDLEPILVCDASGQLRLTYKLWKLHRGNLVELYLPGKTYGNLRIRWWNRGAGKKLHRVPAAVKELASGASPKAVSEHAKGNRNAGAATRGVRNENPSAASLQNVGAAPRSE